MPKLPDWAEGGRIIYDKVHPFAYVRKGRREPWTALVKSGRKWLETDHEAVKLEKCRERLIEGIMHSVGNHIKALHPGARQVHLRRNWNTHMCEAPYEFKTAEGIKDATCPTCIAIASEDLQAKVKAIGPDLVEEQREHVRNVREFNTLGRLVTGEAATTDL